MDSEESQGATNISNEMDFQEIQHLETPQFEFSSLQIFHLNSEDIEDPTEDPLGVLEINSVDIREEECSLVYPGSNLSVVKITEADPLRIPEQFNSKLPFEYPVRILQHDDSSNNFNSNGQRRKQKHRVIPDPPEIIELDSNSPEIIELDADNPELKSTDCIAKTPEKQKLDEKINQELENHDELISYTISFYGCAECSIVFETEEKLKDHDKLSHPERLLGSASFLQDDVDETPQTHESRCTKEELLKMARQRILRVSLENICTRTNTCGICGMSVPILEFSNHRRGHAYSCNTPSTRSPKTCRTETSTKSLPSRPAYRKSKTQLRKVKIHTPASGKSSVRLKMKVEAMTKPHQCRFCDKRFVSASQCKSHENAHSGFTANTVDSTVPAPIDCITSTDLASNNPKRGPSPKVNVEPKHTDDNQSDHCLKCSLLPDQCRCKSKHEDNTIPQANDGHFKDLDKLPCAEELINDVIEKAQLQGCQGMPILKPRMGSLDDVDWSMDANNSDCGPPELMPEESVTKHFLKDARSDEIIEESENDTLDTCQTCGEEISRSNLLVHIRSHLEKGQRDCSLCEYQGHCHKDLREHLSKHYGLRPYECRFCNKNFCWETGLKKHMLVAHQDMTPFKCSQCTLRFETHRERRRHELTHKNISKPGGRNVSGTKPSRRFSLNPPQSTDKILKASFPRRRSLSITANFSSNASNAKNFNQSLRHDVGTVEEEVDRELRTKSLRATPDFTSIIECNILNSEFGASEASNTDLIIDFKKEFQPKVENESSEESQNKVLPFCTELQLLAPIPEFNSFSTLPSVNLSNSNVDIIKENSDLDIRNAQTVLPDSYSEIQASSSLPIPVITSKSVENIDIQRLQEGEENHHTERLSNNGSLLDPEKNKTVHNTTTFQAHQKEKKQAVVYAEVYHEKPDPRESEKCKTCNMKIPIDDLMNHIQSHLKPGQKKCDICTYEATSSKLLPEHVNIHYLLKPFQCNICKRRFAMKGYLRSHHQQVHESSDNRRYACQFCEKRFVRPCHRKAHEKGVHLREGVTPLSSDDSRSSTEKKKLKESKGRKTNGVKIPPTPVPDLPVTPITHSTTQVYQSQNYTMPTTWSNSSHQVVEYSNQSDVSTLNRTLSNAQGQSQIEVKQEDYWTQAQHQNETQTHFHSQPIPSTSSNLSHDIKPNINWSDFQTTAFVQTNEFDLKGADLNPNQYINTQHLEQGQRQMQDFSYNGNANAFNYQGFSSAGGAPIEQYPYSSSIVQNGAWPDTQNSGALAPVGPIAMNYGSYNPSYEGSGDCVNNIIGADARWSTSDPYGILQTHNEPPVLHENTYTISRPSDSVVDLWAELRNEELKLFPENGFGSYSQLSGSSMGMSHQQNQNNVHDGLDGSAVVPLIAPSRTVPLIPDLMESSDRYLNGYFDGIQQVSPANMYEPNVDGIMDTLFDEMPDLTPEDSLSVPSGDDFERLTSKVPCRTCGQKFLKTDLIAHVRSHLIKGQKTCDICQHTFCSSVALRDHLTTHYQYKPHQCLTCCKYFSTKQSLRNHIVCIHEGKKEVKCAICSRSFTLVFSLRRHMRLVHKINPKNGLKLAPSLIPLRGQSDKSDKARRQRKEKKQTRLEPVHLRLMGSETNALEVERRNDLYQEIFERSWAVNLVDIGRNKITCGFCQEFIMVQDLINHRQSHKEPCHICGKPVGINEMLHHGITHVISLYCELCNWKGQTRSQLFEHGNVHKNVKPIKCNICGAAFASRTSLRTHFLARHTNFRPHQCNYCERNFVQLSVRRMHEMTHYGTSCPICDQHFTRKKDLGIHMKNSHTDVECLRKHVNVR